MKMCQFCLGCNKLELEYFIGINRCNNFIPAIENWQETYRKNLKKYLNWRKYEDTKDSNKKQS